MSRLIDPFEQFFDSAGDPLIGGKLFFYESGSSSVSKDTFADSAETIANSNPVIVQGDGRAPNVFGNGSYRVILTDKDDVQVIQRDPVGGSTGTQFGADWNSVQIYGVNDVVRENNVYWISLVSGNQNNLPSTDAGANWVKWPADFFGADWNSVLTYNIPEVVLDGSQYWVSLVNSNTGNQPSTDGGINWTEFPPSPRVTETVATLVALSPVAGLLVQTKGYTTAGDGGDGSYLIKTEAQRAAAGDVIDERSVITLANGNFAILQVSSSTSAFQFGAIGNGTAGDLAALNAAGAALAVVLLNEPKVSYNLSAEPSGIFVSIGPVTLSGAGSTLTVTDIRGDVAGPASAVNEAVARYDATTGKLLQASLLRLADDGSFVFPNNVPAIRQADDIGNVEDEGNQTLLYLDADQSVVFTPKNPHFSLVMNLPIGTAKKQVNFQAYNITDAVNQTLASQGMIATQQSAGGTLTHAITGERAVLQIDTGSAGSGDGYLLEFPSLKTSTASLTMVGFQFDISSSLQQRLECGLWDGTTANAIFLERAEGASSTGMVFKTADGGATTTTGLGIGADTNRYQIRIFAVSATEVEILVSGSAISSGEFITYSSHTVNVHAGVLYPFLRFRNLDTNSKQCRVDQIFAVSNR